MPDEWWRLTPGEFALMCEGYSRRRERDRELAAWQVSHLVSAWTGKQISVQRLLGREEPFETADDFRAHMRRKQGLEDDD